MTPVDLHDELELALSLADAVDLFTLPHFVDRDFTVDWKHNQTEVTEIDRHAESLIVERLIRSRPHHGVFGEEHGLAGAADSEWRWVIDPIDGTGNFSRGESPFGILIALVREGETEAGWIYDPVTQRLCHACRGEGAWINGEPVKARTSGSDRPIIALYTSFMEGQERVRVDEAAASHFTIVPPPMCAAEQYPLLVTGRHDVTIYRRSLPWDHAAGALFLNEAGGKIARFDGTPYRPDQTEMSGMLAAASPELWDMAADVLL